jgi:hypothetical protein
LIEVGDNLYWLNHPKFVKTRDEVLHEFRTKEFNFRKVKPVIFLCGGFGSLRRDRIAEYLSRNHPNTLTFYADNVWPIIAGKSELNALGMEEELAALSDLVLIVVESPGTFTELGAFSISEPLRKKLLPIIDIQFREFGSFINTGPVRWIDQDSKFGPTLWVNFDRILQVVKELDDRLSRLPKPTVARIPDLASSPKHLLFFICDLISVFGPAPLEHIQYYVEKIIDASPIPKCISLIGLAKAMDLIKVVTDKYGIDLYYRPLENGKLVSFQNRRYLQLPSLRGIILSVMFNIDSARSVLELIRG